MSLPDLLYWEPWAYPADPMQNDRFAFEHFMAHNTLIGSLAPFERFSALPYGPLYPGFNVGDWHQDHQQAHNDFISVLPGFFGGTGFGGIPTPTADETLSQLGPVVNLLDYDLDSPDQRTFWTFQNHYAHLWAQGVQDLETLAFF